VRSAFDPNNVTISSCSYSAPAGGVVAGSNGEMVVMVRNTNSAAATGTLAVLKDGQDYATQGFSVPASNSEQVRAAFTWPADAGDYNFSVEVRNVSQGASSYSLGLLSSLFGRSSTGGSDGGRSREARIERRGEAGPAARSRGARRGGGRNRSAVPDIY